MLTILGNCFCCKGVPFVWCTLANIQLTRFHIFCPLIILPLNMLYFKSVAILMHDITNNLAPQNISRLFNATDQVHACNTSSSSRGDYEIGRWLQNRLSKRQSLSTTTVLFRTTFTRTIKLGLLLKWLLGSNLSQLKRLMSFKGTRR